MQDQNEIRLADLRDKQYIEYGAELKDLFCNIVIM